ncbi:MAG: DEAD/DEAH box helicase [Clostridiales bacterium]|nr:DEAD/DEAH box helicase [Clostridiales bacterium]
MQFEQTALSREMQRAIQDMGFTEMTEVQEKTIPEMMEGKDVIAKAPTGTGKTCAFGVPIIERIDGESDALQCLILAPTRELTSQITEDMRAMAKYKEGLRIVSVYGGQSMQRQLEHLKKKPQIIVATPGRLLDHIKRKTVKLHALKTVVLDEADEMLDMGFIKDVTNILDRCPKKKQVVMFSATISREVMDISWLYQRDVVEITVLPKEKNEPKIAQYSLHAEGEEKVLMLARLLQQADWHRVMIFCNTKYMTDRLTKRLCAREIKAECLHGDIKQSVRNKVMKDFREGKFPVLVATDVAARGIDVDDIDAVINFDMPADNASYLHRIGRTGRAGKEGVAYSLVSITETDRLESIMRWTKHEIIALRMDEEGNLTQAPKQAPKKSAAPIRRRRRRR